MSRVAPLALFALLAVACTVADPAPAEDLAAVDPSEPVDLGDDPARSAPGKGGTKRDPAPGGDAALTDPVTGLPSVRADRFATRVVSFAPGPCAGFGQADMPGIVLGPPKGGGTGQGSLDVLSLGKGGEIVLSFEPNAVVDGPGADLVVFENAFYPSGDASSPFAETAEVSVSEDGVAWKTFACAGAVAPPYGSCAGWHPVLATNEDDALDPARAGGDAFDLAEVGLSRARFVRIKDKTAQRCTSQGPNTNGFDLDAIAALHAEDPAATP